MKRIMILTLVIFSGLIFDIEWAANNQTVPDYHLAQLDSIASDSIEIIPLNIVHEMIAEVNQERLLTDIRRLTGEEPICTDKGCYTIKGRETGSEGLQWAKDYVTETLANLSFSVEVQDWNFLGYSDQNILARKQGLVYPGDEIYFIAHLDGYLDNNPAADDDASGVVSLLELARILSGRFLSRTVVIIFSTGEEHGSLGSRSYVEQLTPDQLNAIQYVVSADMLGYDSNDDGKIEIWSGDQKGDFANLLAEIISAYQIGLTSEIFKDCY